MDNVDVPGNIFAPDIRYAGEYFGKTKVSTPLPSTAQISPAQKKQYPLYRIDIAQQTQVEPYLGYFNYFNCWYT